MKEHKTAPHTIDIVNSTEKNSLMSRRQLLRLFVGTLLTGVASVESRSHGLWRFYFKELLRPSVWFRKAEAQSLEVYEHLATRIDTLTVLPQRFNTARLAELDTGLQLYFTETLTESHISYIQNICDLTDTDIGFVLAATGNWSREKIRSAPRMQSENLVAFVQSILSSSADTASEVMSIPSSVFFHGDLDNERWKWRSNLETLGSDVMPGWNKRGFISTRTVGFSDRGVSVYSDAFEYFRHSLPQLQEMVTQRDATAQPAFAEIVHAVQQWRDTYTAIPHQQTEEKMTWSDGSQLLEAALPAERLLVTHKENTTIGLGIEVLLRCYQYHTIIDTLRALKEKHIIDWEFPPFSLKNQQVLVVMFMLISSDAFYLYDQASQSKWNNRTDGDNIHPDWVISKTIVDLLRSNPALCSMDTIDTVDPHEIIRTFIGSTVTKKNQPLLAGYRKTLEDLLAAQNHS